MPIITYVQHTIIIYVVYTILCNTRLTVSAILSTVTVIELNIISVIVSTRLISCMGEGEDTRVVRSGLGKQAL